MRTTSFLTSAVLLLAVAVDARPNHASKRFAEPTPTVVAPSAPSKRHESHPATPSKRHVVAPQPSHFKQTPQPSAHPPNKRDAAAPSSPSGTVHKRGVEEQESLGLGLSANLCPSGLTACPIAPVGSLSLSSSTWGDWNVGFECVEPVADLANCGGCSSFDAKYDCTAIPGALSVSCVVGACALNSCKTGHTLSIDGRSCVEQ